MIKILPSQAAEGPPVPPCVAPASTYLHWHRDPMEFRVGCASWSYRCHCNCKRGVFSELLEFLCSALLWQELGCTGQILQAVFWSLCCPAVMQSFCMSGSKSSEQATSRLLKVKMLKEEDWMTLEKEFGSAWRACCAVSLVASGETELKLLSCSLAVTPSIIFQGL